MDRMIDRSPRWTPAAAVLTVVLLLGGCSASAPTSTIPARESGTAPASSQRGAAGAVARCGAVQAVGPTPTRGIRVHPFGTAATVDDYGSVRIAVTVRRPRVVLAVTERPPRAGMQYLAVPVSVRLVSGTSDFVGSVNSFGVVDAAGRGCQVDDKPGVIAAGGAWVGATVNSTHRVAAGTMVFQVPFGPDPGTLRVAFGNSGNRSATDEWRTQ